MSRRIAGAALLVALAACRLPPIHPPALAPAEPEGPPSVSHLELPLTVDPAELIAAANGQIPASHEAMGAWTPLEPGETPLAIKYRLRRTKDFRLVAHPGLVAIRAEYAYEVHFAKRVEKPWPFSGYFWLGLTGWTGTRAIDVAATVAIDPQWKVSIHTSVGGIPDQLKGRFAVDPAPLAARLQQQVDAERKRLSEEWRRASTPIQVAEAPPTWFLFRPVSYSLVPLHSTAETLATGLVMDAMPQVVIATEAPKVEVPEMPGPQPLRSLANRVDLALDGRISYEEANEQLGALVGTEIEGKHFYERATIRGLKVFGGADRVVVAAQLDGPVVKGTVYLGGAIRYDDVAYKLFVPAKAESAEQGLDFTLETRNAIPAAANWLLHSKLVDLVQKRCVWYLGSQIDQQSKAIASGFEKLSGGRSTLKDSVLTPSAPVATKDGFLVRLRFAARIENRT